jgi:hypothetical protein
MTAGFSSDVKLEIGHVLLIDIVDYSKLLIKEQRERDTRRQNSAQATGVAHGAAVQKYFKKVKKSLATFWNFS